METKLVKCCKLMADCIIDWMVVMMMQYKSLRSELDEFIIRSKRLFIYGAGYFGRLCANYVSRNGEAYEGFITSKISEDNTTAKFFGAENLLASLGEDDGVIIAMKPQLQSEIIEWTRKANCRCLFPSEEMLHMLELDIDIRAFDRLVQINPAIPFTFLSDYNNILIIRLDVIGDMIWTTPFLREIRRAKPNAKITLVLRREIYEFMKLCPYVDEFVCYDISVDDLKCKDYQKIIQRTSEFAQKYLIDKKYDLLILPRFVNIYDCYDNVFLAVFSGCRTRIGRVREKNMGDMLKPMFSMISVDSTDRHEVENILGLLELCGIESQAKQMEFWISNEDKAYASNILKNEDAIRIAIVLSARNPNRSWEPDNYVVLIHLLQEQISYYTRRQTLFVLMGGRNDQAIARIIASQYPCLDLTGMTTIAQAAAVMELCNIYIGPNTGMVHVAGAVGTPVVEFSAQIKSGNIITMYSPKCTGAWGVNHISLMPEKGLDEGCQLAGQCIKDYSHCINQVTPEEVSVATLELLQENHCF